MSETNDESQENRYDSNGNVCPNGAFDAGGHLIDAEKIWDHIDHLLDTERHQ